MNVSMTFAPQNASAIEVSRDYLVWRKDFDYQTRMEIELTLNQVSFKGKLKELPMEVTQVKAFCYGGRMLYDTTLTVPRNYNGSARRRHNHCSMSKVSLTEPTMRIAAGVFDKLKAKIFNVIPKELRDDYEAVIYEESGKILIKPKHPEAWKVLERMNPDFKGIIDMADEYIPAFQGKVYTLEWTEPDEFKKAQLSITPEVGTINEDVRELISREACFLYTNILQSNKKRTDGDVWLVQSEDLSAMVHPTVDGKFRGKVVVKASWEEKSIPILGEPITGWKLEFIPEGVIDGITYKSDIEFVCKDNSGKSHHVELRPIGSRFIGELWLDNAHQMVRYGRLVCKDAPYEGKMPKIANLNLEMDKLTAKINFELTYLQAVSAKEGE